MELLNLHLLWSLWSMSATHQHVTIRPSGTLELCSEFQGVPPVPQAPSSGIKSTTLGRGTVMAMTAVFGKISEKSMVVRSLRRFLRHKPLFNQWQRLHLESLVFPKARNSFKLLYSMVLSSDLEDFLCWSTSHLKKAFSVRFPTKTQRKSRNRIIGFFR